MTAAAQLTPQHHTNAQPACWSVDPELFYGPADSPIGRVADWEQRALLVCAGCPVKTACLAAALEFPAEGQYGVVGGMTAGQRRVLLSATRRSPTRSSMTGRTRNRRPRPVRPVARLVPAGMAR